MKRIMLLAVLAIVAALVVGCQNDDADEGDDDSRQPAPQYVTTPEVTQEVTHETTQVIENTLPDTGGA